MPVYRYKAANLAGEILEGEMDAATRETVVRRLQAQGHVTIRADEIPTLAGVPRPRATPWLRRRRIGEGEVALFTAELGALLAAGMPLDRALEVLEGLAADSPLGAILAGIHADVRRGSDLSRALEAHPRVFSPLYVNLVRSGEAAGALDPALERLAAFLEQSRALRSTVVSALIYPAILVLVTVISLAVILGVVIPRISLMFEDAGATLPWSTQVVIGVGATVAKWWWVGVLGALGMWAWLRQRAADPEWRRRLDGWVLSLPAAGELVRKLEVARFTRTLGTLLASGVPLLEALGIAREVVGNRRVGEAVTQAAERVRRGEGLAGSLGASGAFPALAVQLLAVGEETGSLEPMLLRLADLYDREVHTAVQRLGELVGPILILVLGLAIGGVILSVLAAVMSVNELAF